VVAAKSGFSLDGAVEESAEWVARKNEPQALKRGNVFTI
jgi:hypothetical protein